MVLSDRPYSQSSIYIRALLRAAFVHIRRDRAGHTEVRVGATYPLDRATDAHSDLEARKTTGSIVLIP